MTSSWLYYLPVLTMHGHSNIKHVLLYYGIIVRVYYFAFVRLCFEDLRLLYRCSCGLCFTEMWWYVTGYLAPDISRPCIGLKFWVTTAQWCVTTSQRSRDLDFQISQVNVKGKVSVHALKSHRGNTGIAALVVNLSTRCEWLVRSAPPATHCPGKSPS